MKYGRQIKFVCNYWFALNKDNKGWRKVAASEHRAPEVLKPSDANELPKS
jgi:hypothetical protein